VDHAGSYTLHAADWVMLTCYFAIMTGIGLYFARFQQSAREYFAGRNRIPWWVAGASLWMSGFSALGFVAYAEMGYKYGFVAITMFWSVIPACILSMVFLAPRWRRTGILTPVEFLETRYNLAIRQLFAWAGVPAKIVDDGMKVGALGIFIAAGLKVDLTLSIIVSGLVMLTYTVIGGLWAVCITDVVQFIIMTVAAVILVPMAIAKVGGLSGFIEGSPPGFFHLFSEDYAFIYFLGFLVLIAISYNGSWARVQRYYSVENEREAKKAVVLDMALEACTGPIFIIAAMAARQFLPDLINPTDPNLNSKMTFPLLCFALLPAGTIGLVLSAMFAATMSSLDSDFNVVSAILTRDFYQRLIRPNATEAQLVRVGKIMTLIVGGVAIGIALIIVGIKTEFFRIMNTWLGLVLPPTMLPIIMGLVTRRYGWRAALGGFLGGLAAGVAYMIFQKPLEAAFPSVGPHNLQGVSMLANAVATVAAMELVALFERRSPEEQERTEQFFQRLERPLQAVPPEGELPSPFFIVGISTLAAGLVLAVTAFMEIPHPLSFHINLGLGLLLAAIGAALWAASRRTVTNAADRPDAGNSSI
jgi:SSS family solute:Na+ symporter